MVIYLETAPVTNVRVPSLAWTLKLVGLLTWVKFQHFGELDCGRLIGLIIDLLTGCWNAVRNPVCRLLIACSSVNA